jgi:hypothetical protein
LRAPEPEVFRKQLKRESATRFRFFGVTGFFCCHDLDRHTAVDEV